MTGRATILVAGGGTGGHVYPGLAVADALRSIADVDVVFVGTARGREARVIPQQGYRLELLDVRLNLLLDEPTHRVADRRLLF